MRRLLLGVLCCALPAGPAFAWGQTGHRITGALAERYLSGTARAHVQLLLGSETLAQAATWPDDMRSDPSIFWQKTASPYHFVTVPQGKTYADVGAPAEGDAMSALKNFTATLKNPNATLADKQLALRFIVHIIGDLHQPLHAGREGDRGGNNIRVTLFGQQTSLHTVWDSGLIDQRQLSWSEYSGWLAGAMAPQQIIDWSTTDPAAWIAESVTLREQIYPSDPKLSYEYAYTFGGMLDQRLSQAGVRIAAYLNSIFA